ncbi:MAG: sigma-54-dependent Fis family transcriptional regulator [Rhizobiaceae bacterium]|nr:sigma-54-dependent Fis family transcriptional regulator [Rhizobiaceae bacterium]
MQQVSGHSSGMDRARAALEGGLRFPAGMLSGPVATSWQRCRDFGLDPRSRPRGDVIPFEQVSRRRDALAALRRLALAEMQLLYSQIAGSSFTIALGDAAGVVLDTISDQQFADSEEGRVIIPGSVWREAERGTNALGLAALEKQPVAVYGREHYFACHGHLSCMAAPILDSRGEVLGLLDASCANEARQQHTHALVRMAAAQIENGLIFHERSESFIFAFHPRAEYLDTLSAGLIAVSRDGRIHSINRPGTALLSGLPAEIGGRFEALFEAAFSSVMDGLLKGGVVRVRDRAGSGLFMVCRQIGRRSMGASSVPAAVAAPLVRNVETPDFVCDDAALQAAIREAADAAALAMPVHITGETGTGKDLMARHVHALSRRKGEFVAVNCGALPEPLFVSELFGHERGAFTNARSDGSPGLARLADKGTLFLDEVADIPLAAQTALLRFLDTMEVRAVGGQKLVRLDVQIVSATNRDLHEMVAARAFRGDLLYRLNAFSIHLPPLAARTDFGGIVRHLVARIAPGVAITDAAIARLARRKWPGNARELNAVLQRALLRRRMEHLDEEAFDAAAPAGPTEVCAACRGHPLNERRCQEMRSAYLASGGNVSQAARRLGVSRTTLYKHVRPAVGR